MNKNNFSFSNNVKMVKVMSSVNYFMLFNSEGLLIFYQLSDNLLSRATKSKTIIKLKKRKKLYLFYTAK